MPIPQTGIFEPASPYHHFLEYALETGTTAEAAIRALAGTRIMLGAGSKGDGASVVVAFGARLWHEAAPKDAPEGLRAFEAIEGTDGLEVASTQRDLLFWIHGARIDDNLDRAFEIHRNLGPAARLELDQPGFIYHDSRDLTGFIDGTANPKEEAARAAALVPGDRPGGGGAFVLSQKWVHDLESFLALPVPEQERVIGRTKPDSVELEGDAMPPDSHVARTDVALAGVAQKIYRRSVPFATMGERGLYFLAFSCDLSRFEVLLARMFGVSEDGLCDRLTAYSKPLTSSYWFAPSEDALQRLMGPR